MNGSDTMHETNIFNSHPMIGACIALMTGAAGLTAMQLTQGIISITAGLLSIALLIIQLRKALKS